MRNNQVVKHPSGWSEFKMNRFSGKNDSFVGFTFNIPTIVDLKLIKTYNVRSMLFISPLERKTNTTSLPSKLLINQLKNFKNNGFSEQKTSPKIIYTINIVTYSLNLIIIQHALFYGKCMKEFREITVLNYFLNLQHGKKLNKHVMKMMLNLQV